MNATVPVVSASRGLLVLLCLALVLPALAEPPLVPDGSGASRVVDKPGEEEQIRARREWFLSSRRSGLTAPGEMAALRRRAAEETRARIAAQLRSRAAGAPATANFWVSMGPSASHFGGWAFGNVSGRITGIARDAHGNIYISSATGGVFKTTNDGLSWTNVFETSGTQPTGAVAVDPNDDNVLWVGTGDYVTGCEGYFGIGLLRSTDGGQTWQPRNGSGSSTLDDLSNFSSVVVDPRDSNHLVVGGPNRGCTSGQQLSGGLYTTTDGGLTWTRRIGDTPVHEIQQDPTNRDVFWAGTGQGIYKSIDNGVTWTKQTASGLPSSNTGRTEIAVAPSNGNYVYALFENGGPGFWRTTNGGTSWTRMSSGSNACDGQCWYNMTLAVHRTDPDTVYRGTILIFKSTDGGATWIALTNGWGSSQQVHQDTHAIFVDPSAPDKFYVGCDGGMWRSGDGGATFVNLNTGLDLFQFYAIDHQEGNAGVICGGAQDNSSLVRTTSNVWDLQQVTGDGFVCGINAQQPTYSYIASYPYGGYPSVSRSTTGVLGSYAGITGAGSGIVAYDRTNWVTPYTLDPNHGSTLLLGTDHVYRSTDYGTSWVPVGPPDMTNGSGRLTVVEFNRADSRVAYAGTNDGRTWRSGDNGVIWTDISAGLPASVGVNDVAGDPEDPERALAVLGGFNHAHLYEWTVAAGRWTAIGSGLPNVPANTVLLETGAEVYVGTDVGVYRSLDRGQNFEPFMDGLPQGLVVTDLKFGRKDNVLTAGTYGRGAYQVSVAPPGPIVMFDSIVLPMTPVDGDGDGSVEPGETWQVVPVLRNAGGLPATDVRARLRTTTPGVRVLSPDAQGFGSIAPGGTGPALAPFTFSVDPSFPCGGVITFDVVDITAAGTAPFKDQPGAFTVTVVNDYGPPVPSTLMDERFDPRPTTGWTHEVVDVTTACTGKPNVDEWKFASRDATHGQSEHCGNGPGKSYSNYNHSWLHYNGKASTGGPGLDIPADAISATLTLLHWYKTQSGADGGQVVIDGVQDNADNYTPLVPNGGYPGTLAAGYCNPQEGRAAFTGSSAGWVTHTFDLTRYAGRKVYLAFVFASDSRTSTDEGWYIDEVKVDIQRRGAPVCQTTSWAGLVPDTARFSKSGSGLVQVSWDPACNSGTTPGQGYSIQAGPLDPLASAGTYGHAPWSGRCDLASPATITPASGNEYYLVVANVGGREGGAGRDSAGNVRPQTSALCGTRHEPACP